MASGKRPSRILSRTSSPLPPQPAVASPSRNHVALQKNITTGNDWVEPPLRPPAPSFMDHKGGERVGVLEQMQPLGAFPTSKAKARSKAELARRMVQRDQGENTIVEESSATPDVAPQPMGTTRAASITGTEHPIILRPTTPVGLQRVSAEVPPQAAAISLPPSLALSSLLATPSSQPTNTQSPTSQVQSIIQTGTVKACHKAQSRNEDLEWHLLALEKAAVQDPELATLLKYAMTNDSLKEHGSPIVRKIKQLRSTLRLQRGSPQSRQSSAIGGDFSLSNTNMSVSPSHASYRTLAPATPRSGQIPRLLPSAMPPTFSPPSIRNATMFPTTSPAKTPGANEVIAKGVSEPPQTISRRSSSSSLSSIDEGLASGPPPTLPVPQVLNRSSAVSESLIDDDDVDVDAKRMGMRKNFDDVNVAESNLRQPSGPDVVVHDASSQPKSFPKLKLNYHTGPPRGSLATPPSEGIAAGSTAALKRPATPTALGRPPKRIKTAAKVKISPQKNQQPAVIAGIARHESRRQGSAGFDEHNSEQSENNDYCSSCGGTGFLLCCDGCDRSFHFTCLDPPLNPNATLDEPWYCHLCHSDRGMQNYSEDGLFAELHRRIEKKNPSAFKLPEDVRGYFENVRTGDNGEYAEVVLQRTTHAKGRNGYDDAPDYKRLYDAKGNVILCFTCGKSSLGHRDIIPCDHCTAHWHLDCLDPPLANPPNRGPNPKTRPPWMCPLHVDHDLRNLDPLERNGVRYEGLGRTHRVRRPKHPSIVIPALRRGFKNNGLIEIASESDDGSETEEEEAPDGTIYKLSTEGIKLDFIDKVKSKRASAVEADIQNLTRVATLNARLSYLNERRLSEDISRRRTAERAAALNLAQFASENQSIDLGMTEMERLIHTLEAVAEADILATMPENTSGAAPHTGKKRISTLPSPPASSTQLDMRRGKRLNDRDREVLTRMQEYIKRRLDMDKPYGMTNGA